MQSNILHLVCDLWSVDWKDKIILIEAAVECLLKQGLKSTDKELTSEKVKDAAQIYAPIVSSGHYSPVVVSHTAAKKYILDSLPGTHEKVANDLLTNLESYLRTEHGIDISQYDIERPKVQPQKNNFDCGFHVLLYIRGFERMEIFDIDKEKVLMLRQELSKYLLLHSTNTKNPMLGPVDEETDDEDDDEEECKVIAKPDAAKSNTATSGISHAANSNTGTGSSQQDSHVDKSTGVTPPELPLGHNSTPDSESTVLTPPVMHCKRRACPRNAPNVKFEERRFLPSESCEEVRKLIQTKFDGAPVFAVGETTMTGGDLLKFLEEGHNALSIMNAFVHCVKFDDKTKSYHQSRIIIPTKDLNDEALVQAIVEELKANNMMQRFVRGAGF